jgi:hypothetical protein
MEFPRRAYEFGFDRYSIIGDYMTATCRLWKKGEAECSIRAVSSTIQGAILEALAAIEILTSTKE